MKLERDEIGYALAKQIDSAYALQTSYGELALTKDMQATVANALRPLLMRQWREAGVVDCGDEPMCTRDFCDAVRSDLASRPDVLYAINQLIEKAAWQMNESRPGCFENPYLRAILAPKLAQALEDELRRHVFPDGGGYAPTQSLNLRRDR